MALDTPEHTTPPPEPAAPTGEVNPPEPSAQQATGGPGGPADAADAQQVELEALQSENANLRRRVRTVEQDVRALTDALADENRRLYLDKRALRNAIDFELSDAVASTHAFKNNLQARAIITGAQDKLYVVLSFPFQDTHRLAVVNLLCLSRTLSILLVLVSRRRLVRSELHL